MPVNRIFHSSACSSAAPAGRRFGFVGRMVEGKGIPATLDALRLLKERGLCPSFVFVGDGPLAEGVRDAVLAHGLANVTLAGVLAPPEAVKRMDVIVLASESEAMPLVLVEALSAGHPCIATQVGGIPDLIRDGQEGVLLANGSAAAIADAIERVLGFSETEWMAMVGRARARYEECCTPERVGDVVERHYRAIAGKG